MQIHQQLALSKPRSPEEYRETLLVCQRATTQMHQLVESLLTLARLESGSSMATNHSSVPLKTIVIDCVAHTEALLKTRQAHVDANLEEIMVCGDATQLGQVVTNLLINAVEHSPVGVHVTVTLKRESQEVCLTVADTGPGIAAEHLPHLFDRFYRVDQDRSRESGGSGLGLSIVQAIVRSHGV